MSNEKTHLKIGRHTSRELEAASETARDRLLREFTSRDGERGVGQGRADGTTLKSR